MINRLRFCVLLSVLAAGLATGLASAASRSTGFDRDGRVLTDFPGGEAKAQAIVNDRGRLLVVGGASKRPDENIALARYLRDGRLDRSFSRDGRLITDLGPNERAIDVKIDSRGRMVVIAIQYRGKARPYLYRDTALVLRYLPQGDLDPSFGTGGVVRLGLGEPVALAIGPGDEIVVAGPVDGPDAVVRLMPDGTVDPRFPPSGVGVRAIADLAEEVVVDSAGRILVAGCRIGQEGEEEPEAHHGPLVVTRFTSDGERDSSFGFHGKRSIQFNDGETCTSSVAIDSHDRVLLAGTGEYGWHISRLLPSGRPDRSFAATGRATIDRPRLSSSSDPLDRNRLDLAVDNHDRVVLAGGFSLVSSGPRLDHRSRFALARLKANGRLDLGFGGKTGLLAVRFGAGRSLDAGANGVTLVGDTVYAAGFAAPRGESRAPTRFALARVRGG